MSLLWVNGRQEALPFASLDPQENFQDKKEQGPHTNACTCHPEMQTSGRESLFIRPPCKGIAMSVVDFFIPSRPVFYFSIELLQFETWACDLARNFPSMVPLENSKIPTEFSTDADPESLRI